MTQTRSTRKRDVAAAFSSQQARAMTAKEETEKNSPSAKNKKLKKIAKGDSNSTDLDVPWYHVFTRGDPEYNEYMATEWSFEKRGDRALFEKICLEGAQSGLSWQTILRKRDAYRKVFYNFDPKRVAKMTEKDVQAILDTPAGTAPRETIVRHRGKIEATINNAKCLLQMQKEAGDSETALDAFLWSFVDDKPILNRWGAKFNPFDYGSLKDCPSQTPHSQAMSKALKEKGWKFVGPTTCYALMQSSGMVIDHPLCTPEWEAARQRLLSRPGGFQEGANES